MEQFGFFSEQELAAVAPPGCGNGCQLYETCEIPRVPVKGRGAKRIMVVGEVPGPTSREGLAKVGIELDRDCWTTSACICAPNRRSPTAGEVAACRPNVAAAIAKHKPALVLAFGKSAMEAVVGQFHPELAHGKSRGFPLLRGMTYPDTQHGCWVCVAEDWSHVLRMKFDPSVQALWLSSVLRALSKLEQPLPYIDGKGWLHITQKPEAIEKLLHKILNDRPWIAFDYETTGKKPFAKGHDVVSIGVAFEGHAYAFPTVGTKYGPARKLWSTLLAEQDVHKVAHNTAFERMWSATAFGTEPVGWIGDTCILAHMEDGRRSYSGLEVQSALKIGAPAYKDEMEAYKRASKADEDAYGANAINRMKQAPIPSLLTYNARDALHTWHIYNHFLETGVADGTVYG